MTSVPTLITLLLQIGIVACAYSYTDFGFNLGTLSLLAGPDMNEEFELGAFAKFRFDFTTTRRIHDTVTIDFGAYYNGYSALVFCGDPEIEYSEGDVDLAFETIDESIGLWYDTLKLDFGKVDWPNNTNFAITFDVMLINHELYTPGSKECCYWFGAGVEYNSGMANWVTDIAFSLAEPNADKLSWGVSNSDAMNTSALAMACHPRSSSSKVFSTKTEIKAIQNLLKSY